MLYIVAYNLEKAQSLVLEVAGEKALEFLKKFDFDFDKFAKALRVEENGTKLVLLQPNPEYLN